MEQAKLRLEMTLEQIRKENKKELAQRDEELEEVRCNAHKKVKGTAQGISCCYRESYIKSGFYL